MSLLATYVQISDLHIGMPDGGTGDAKTSALIKRLASTYSSWHGSLGHQARSIQYLRKELNALRATGEPFEVIVTGDFTRCGGQDELDLAYALLTSKVSLRRSRPSTTGLSLVAVPLGVPGNHDHWGGDNTIMSVRPTEFHTSKLKHPASYPYIVRGPNLLGRQVVFIGIDSDADVQPGSLERIFAQGDFRTQIASLGRPPNNARNELRILLIHHARQVAGKRLGMTAASRGALDGFLKAASIQVVLSGHTHRAHASPIASVLELSSASTTQIDEAPAGWKNIYNQPPTVKFERNGFLIHRLHDDGGSIRWDVHVMVRGPQGTGFKEATRRTFNV